MYYYVLVQNTGESDLILHGRMYGCVLYGKSGRRTLTRMVSPSKDWKSCEMTLQHRTDGLCCRFRIA
ncbi:MAG: hypothetical protein EGR47_11765 [Clostridium sp.]|nr:hypothetical protein [Clostridium sp.]